MCKASNKFWKPCLLFFCYILVLLVYYTKPFSCNVKRIQNTFLGVTVCGFSPSFCVYVARLMHESLTPSESHLCFFFLPSSPVRWWTLWRPTPRHVALSCTTSWSRSSLWWRTTSMSAAAKLEATGLLCSPPLFCCQLPSSHLHGSPGPPLRRNCSRVCLDCCEKTDFNAASEASHARDVFSPTFSYDTRQNSSLTLINIRRKLQEFTTFPLISAQLALVATFNALSPFFKKRERANDALYCNIMSIAIFIDVL